MSRAGTRRTFLVGLGRFMMGAGAIALMRPPVLYSFPSVIRLARPDEQEWVFGGTFSATNKFLIQLKEAMGPVSTVVRIQPESDGQFQTVYLRKVWGDQI